MAKTTLRKFAAEKGNYAEMQNTSGERAINLNDPDSIINEDHFAVHVWGGWGGGMEVPTEYGTRGGHRKVRTGKKKSLAGEETYRVPMAGRSQVFRPNWSDPVWKRICDHSIEFSLCEPIYLVRIDLYDFSFDNFTSRTNTMTDFPS